MTTGSHGGQDWRVVRSRIDERVFTALEAKAALAGQSVAARIRALIEADVLDEVAEASTELHVTMLKQWQAAVRPKGAENTWLALIDKAVRNKVGDQLPPPGKNWTERLEWAYAVNPHLQAARGPSNPLPPLPPRGSL